MVTNTKIYRKLALVTNMGFHINTIEETSGMPLSSYVRSDPEKGHLYQCPPNGCKLEGRLGVRYCRDQLWENRQDNSRLFGPVRRGSPEWKELYSLRQSVERLFKSLKQSRCLEAHCVRGLLMVGLHASMSVLTYQATALFRLQAGDLSSLRWQVRRVA